MSPDFFATLGLGPMMGRAFTEEETTYAASGVAIVTHAYWTERLNADPQVIGRRIRVDGGERTIVGVLPPGSASCRRRHASTSRSRPGLEERAVSQRHSGSARMVARLAPGRTAAEAQAQIDAHNAAMRASDPSDGAMTAAGFRSIVVPLHGDHVKSVRDVLLLLQIGVVILLLIGGANVANLFLIRSSSRLKELAVRRAIGAGRRHIVTEIMAETMITAVAGAIAGLWIGSAGIAAVRALAADQLPLGARILFDGRVAVAGLAGSVILGVAIGVPLAWYHLKVPSAGALQSESRGGTTARGIRRLRHAFVVTQIAMAFVLLTGAGLLAISLRQVLEVSPGFRSANVISGQITLPGSSYPDQAALVTFTERLAARLAQQPGIVATGFVTNVPLSGISNRSAATVRGYAPAPGESPRGIYSYSVAGDYFAALGYTLREGRFLTGDDSRRRERVCVVDEDFARRNWPGTTAIGKELFEGGQPGANAEAFRVVGVVGAVKQADVTEADALGAVYYPLGHRADRNVFVVARTAAGAGSPGAVLRDSRAAAGLRASSQRHPIDGRADLRQPGRTALPGAPRRRVLRGRAPAGGDRRVWRARLHGCRAAARDRAADRARRPSRPGAPAAARHRAPNAGGGRRHRPRWIVAGRTRDADHPLSGSGLSPADVRRLRPRDRRGVAPGVPGSCPPGRADIAARSARGVSALRPTAACPRRLRRAGASRQDETTTRRHDETFVNLFDGLGARCRRPRFAR